MAASTRPAVAAHALVFLARWGSDGWQSSARIAEPLESNPVLVRRVLGQLQARNLVTSAEGTHAHPPSRRCVIGRHMQALLEEEFAAAQRALEGRLSQTSVADLHRASVVQVVQDVARQREIVLRSS